MWTGLAQPGPNFVKVDGVRRITISDSNNGHNGNEMNVSIGLRKLVLGLSIILAACSPALASKAQPAPGLANRAPASDPLPTPSPRRLKAGDLVLAADVDDIPAIMASRELFVNAAAGDLEIEAQEPVIGVSLNGEAHAYPIRLLSLHEIVNDDVGGIPIAVTWCPLCYTAITFDRRVDSGVLSFGVSGYLYSNNLVMYDHQSNTLWSQALGQAIRGARRGQRLVLQPSMLTTWQDWKELHPDTRLLSIQAVEDHPERAVDPYVGYYTSGAAGITGRLVDDDRLDVKELVIGLAIGQEARAYPLGMVQMVGLVNDQLGGEAMVLVYDQSLNHVHIYRSAIEGEALTFVLGVDRETMIDQGTNSRWDIRSGTAVEGLYQGQNLERIVAPAIFWFAWADLYPDTQVYP
jgi:hypothetical protein